MPPKKKSVAVTAAADSTTPPKRLTRSSSNAAAAPKSSPTKFSTDPDMGSAVSKAKAIKSRRSRKSGGAAAEEPVVDLTKDESAIDVEEPVAVKGKRKVAGAAAEAKAANVKKPRVSKSKEEEEEQDNSITVIPIPPSKPAKAAAKKSAPPKTAEDWFNVYASSTDPDEIDIPNIARLLEDLDIKFESAALYLLFWKLGVPAMGPIPRKNWVDGMKKLHITNNAQLLKTLPTWLQATKPVNPPSEDFQAFYKYMFQFSKSTPEARTVAIESILPALTFSLDPLTYDLKYDPDTAVPLKSEVHPYPHAVPFIEFLTEKQPVKVMNKDQWESFVPFNGSVEYMLGNYDPAGPWPNLYDQYVDWRKEREGLTIGPNDGPDTQG